MEGASRRRPGARMLVTEDGQLAGAVSGGLLTGKALEKALPAMTEQQNKLVMYDTSDADDAGFGIQLGCSGMMYVLFEPILTCKIHNPIELLRQVISERQDTVLVSLFSLEHNDQPGTCLLYRTNLLQSTLPLAFQADVIRDAQEALETQTSSLRHYNCISGRCMGFIQFIPPHVALSKKQGSMLHSPVGLDIGDETAEEIAVSIVADTRALLSGKLLKDRTRTTQHRGIRTGAGAG